MPVPPNTDFTTAIVIPSLPFEIDASADDGVTIYNLWYKYVAVPGDKVLSIFGFGSLATYRPRVIPYTEYLGTPGDLPADMAGASSTNVPLTIPVDVGSTYFFQFRRDGNTIIPANLHISIIHHIEQPYPDESIMIPDDTWGWPGAIMSPTTGEVLKFILGFPAGEEGDSLSKSEGGQILVEDYASSSLKLYDKHLNLIRNIPGYSGGLGDIIAIHSINPKFYIGRKGGGQTPANFSKLSITGDVLQTWIMPVAGLTSLAINVSETKALMSGQGTSLGFVTAWDLVNNVALPNPPFPAGLNLVYFLKNDNIVVSTYDSTARTTVIREYDSAYSLLHSYTFTNNTGARMKHAEDNPISMWCWFTEYPFTGMSIFIKLRLSDGVHLAEFKRTQYEGGTSQADETPTPQDRFGHSFSCPIFILYQGTAVPPASDMSGIYFINPDKTTGGGTGKHDSYYDRGTPPSSTGGVEKKIPDPIIRTALIGE